MKSHNPSHEAVPQGDIAVPHPYLRRDAIAIPASLLHAVDVSAAGQEVTDEPHQYLLRNCHEKRVIFPIRGQTDDGSYSGEKRRYNGS